MKTLNKGLMMRILNILWLVLLLAAPVVADADADEIPGSAVWYLHLDLEQMRSDGPGRGVYDWLDGEAMSEVRDETGIDIGKELDAVTAYALDESGPVILLEGNFSQKTRDQIMAIIAAEGDLSPAKASGKSYYHLTPGDKAHESGDDTPIEIDFEDDMYVSMDVRRKIILAASEDQMRALLAAKGRIPGRKNNGGALLVLSAEKNLLQAGMTSTAFSSDEEDGFESNILRNTERVAILVAAVADKLALEAELVTREAEMAESLASVVRGLISLMSFNEEMDPDLAAVVAGTRVEAKGNSLTVSLALDPELVVQTLSE